MLRRGLGFADRYNGSTEGRIHTMLGPHASYSCGSELLVKIKEKTLQLGIGVHTHIAKSRDMSQKLEKEYKVSEVEYFNISSSPGPCLWSDNDKRWSLFRLF